MPPVYPYLALTDGTDVVEFQTGTNIRSDYMIRDGWAPSTSGVRPSTIGARGRYRTAIEEIEATIIGTSEADCFSKLARLARLLDRAERSRLNQSLASVTLLYVPRGSTVASRLAPLQDQVIGRAPGDETAGITLAPQFDRGLRAYVIERVRVRFERVGLWGEWNTETGTAASVTNGDIATINFPGAADIPSPINVNVSSFQIGNYLHSGFVIVSRVSGGIVVIPAEGAAPATDYTSVNDSANNARDTNVLRFSPSATSERVSAAITAFSLPTLTKRVALYANIRNNSASTTFRLRVRFRKHAYAEAFTRPIVIDPYSGSAFPEWRYIGSVPTPYATTTAPSLEFYISASAASGTLDIDSVVAVDVSDSDASTAIRIDKNTLSSYAGGVVQNLSIDHRLWSARGPQVTANNGYDASYRGSPYFYFADSQLFGIALQTGSDSSPGNSWRAYRGGLYSQTWSLYRRRSYLTPR